MWFVEDELIVPPERVVPPGNRRTDFCGLKWGVKVCLSARVVMEEVD